jgi:hypothetical protein
MKHNISTTNKTEKIVAKFVSLHIFVRFSSILL